jgi:hypothetical protein
MDFAKAFDKVPLQRLLYKLKVNGIKNQTLKWISAFLSNRTQTVVLDGESSDIAPVTSGTSERDWSVIYCVVFFTFFCMLVQHLHVFSQMVRSQSEVIFEK